MRIPDPFERSGLSETGPKSTLALGFNDQLSSWMIALMRQKDLLRLVFLSPTQDRPRIF
jgi:hypothetical protein